VFEAIKPVQKAIVALLTPIVLALLARFVEWAGPDIPVDPTLVETLVASAVSALFVWLVPNRTPDA
jgi:hypothetical protein